MGQFSMVIYAPTGAILSGNIQEKRHNFRGDWVCIAPMHDEFQQVRKETSQEVHMNRVCRRLPDAKNL